MPRLIDYLLRDSWAPYGATFASPADWVSYETAQKRVLEQATVILADNIDDFVHATWVEPNLSKSANGAYALSDKDLPNLFPPFENFFIEWKLADPMARKQCDFAGTHITCLDLDRQPEPDIANGYRARLPAARFVFALRAFLRLRDGGMILCVPSCQLIISESSGRLLDCFPTSYPHRTIRYDQKVCDDTMSAVCSTAIMAITFMNCENVRLRDASQPPALRKAYKRRHGRDLRSSKFIEIQPVCKMMFVRPGESNADAATRIMHQVRGHIKHYADRGLFGRHKGSFFFGAHQRGDFGRGMSETQYAIRLDGKCKV